MYLQLFGAAALLVATALFLSVGAGLLFRLFRRATRRRHRVARGFSSSAAGLGAALLAVTLFYRPSLEHAVETAQVEHVEEDDDGDPDDPAKALNRQLKRIRRGEPVETLVVRR